MDYSHIYTDVAGKRIRVLYPWELKKPLYKRWIYQGAKYSVYYVVYKGE
jgi:hypothetical protein